MAVIVECGYVVNKYRVPAHLEFYLRPGIFGMISQFMLVLIL